MFTDKQTELLKAKLQQDNVKRRSQSGRSFSYIEGWHAIAEANRIFGFGYWSSETVMVQCVAEKERAIGKDKAPGFGVSYIAKVRVTVWGEENVAIVTREGSGAGHGIDRDLGQAHESALKEAETDARKRALMTFGNQFGLALYDPDQENVTSVPTDPAGIEPMPAPTTQKEKRSQEIITENVEWARSFIETAFQKETKADLENWEANCMTRLNILQSQQIATWEWVQAKLAAKYEQLEKAA